MHRFFIPPSTLKANHFSSQDKDLCHQVSKVLKMSAGKQVVLLDNTEHEYLAEWTLVNKAACQAKILEKNHKPDISSQRPVHLYVTPLKNQNRYELILEKCTEIGVASFTPLITARTEVTELRKPERLHRIIKEAAEQSGRTLLPSLNDPIKFNDILESMKNDQLTMTNDQINLICSLHDKSQSIPEILNSPDRLNSLNRPTEIPLGIFIGPVGDFTEEELKQAIEHNFYPASLGSQVLRTETAAVVAAAVCLQ